MCALSNTPPSTTTRVADTSHWAMPCAAISSCKLELLYFGVTTQAVEAAQFEQNDTQVISWAVLMRICLYSVKERSDKNATYQAHNTRQQAANNFIILQ